MLDTLRANSRSVLTYVLFGIIIVVFVVSFGPGSRGCSDSGVRTASYAAKVNGVTVTASEFEQQYTQLFRFYRQRSGSTFTQELADQIGLRTVAMNQLVDRQLVIDEARRHGVAATDDDLNRAVWDMPAFRGTSGQFDKEIYKRAVADAYGSPAKFEERLRRDLAYQKMLALLRQTVKVSDDEIREGWLAESDRANLAFVRFPVAAAKAEVKATDAEVRAFLASSGPRVEQFYKDNAARYRKERQVRARHILVKVPAGAGAAEEDALRKRIEELAGRAKRGEDFGKLAAEASEDLGNKLRGGDLGFFGKGVMAKPFEDAAFALKPGEVSGPVRTRFGWHLIQVEEVKEPSVIPLEQARGDIARELVETDAARKVAERRAEAALAQAKSGKSLAELFPPEPAKDEKPRKAAQARPAKLGSQVLAVEETGLFGQAGGQVPKLGSVPDLAADAFQAGAGQTLPKVYQSPAGPLLAQVKERQRPDPAKLAERRDEIATRLRSRREAQLEAAWLKSLREKAQVKVNEAFLQGAVAAPPVDLE